MLMQTASIELIAIFIGAVILLAIISYALILKRKATQEKKNIDAVSYAIVDYFRKSGVGVGVGSIMLPGTGRFTAFIESEPMKRFRLSHIVEATLREHVHRTCGLELDKVYWRFPIKEAAHNTAETANDQKKEGDEMDDYINEGLMHYKHLPKVEVTELPWETFQEATTIQQTERQAASNTDNA
jgi:hypothetical protein